MVYIERIRYIRGRWSLLLLLLTHRLGGFIDGNKIAGDIYIISTYKAQEENVAAAAASTSRSPGEQFINVNFV